MVPVAVCRSSGRDRSGRIAGGDRLENAQRLAAREVSAHREELTGDADQAVREAARLLVGFILEEQRRDVVVVPRPAGAGGRGVLP